MPTASVGLYEVVFEQSYFTSNIRNVFHYKSTIDVDDAQDLCGQAFDEDVVASLASLMNTSVNFNIIRCKNITGNLADDVIVPTITAGTQVGAIVADFVATSFLYARQTKDTRNGFKRFTGQLEESMLGGGFTVAFQALMASAATVFETNISTVGGIFQPIIVRKPDDGFGVFTYNTLSGVTPLNRVTTQNSRKTF